MNNKAALKNIIFDFGGVIIHIDPLRTLTAFRNLGIKNFDGQYSTLGQRHLFDELEKGSITPAEFRNRIRSFSELPLTDEQIDHAWNAILVDLPEQHIEFLKTLKDKYRLFLLSNTNAIHESAFTAMIQKKFGEDVLKKIFERVYLSHHLKMQKPDPEIFMHVLKENNLAAEETLFVDDSAQHIEGAKKVGLQSFYFKDWKTFEKSFEG
jgi:putative hydrolase of the HAD superfamily